MTPEQLERCLEIIHWTPDTLARVLECDVSLVHAWLNGEAEMPMKASAWIKIVADHHIAFDHTKPKGLKAKRFKS